MSKRWKYDSPDAGQLDDLYETPSGFQKLIVDLEPGQEFDAPDDWLPSPNPHPVFKPATAAPAAKPAPAPAPQE